MVIVICFIITIIIVVVIGTIMIFMIMVMISISILILIMIIKDNLLQDCVAQKELPWPIPKRKNDDVTWVVTNQTGNTNSWLGHMR